ncbi:hypothetical protein GDO81_004512 [Engystomops pustulosus]|uniref:Uncharacterized protein n=1 Tax=Engystomops pustulosus TaxID=76066 RepID=A0AAV6ZWJ3_ENGPU|nr:hypothetical protein GDO81_004512 [Engystomops pustulosus]
MRSTLLLAKTTTLRCNESLDWLHELSPAGLQEGVYGVSGRVDADRLLVLPVTLIVELLLLGVSAVLPAVPR